MESLLAQSYEPHLHVARQLLVDDATVVELLDPAIDPALLERFLIQFSALGVQITEPVDGWIRRAGERCVALGLTELGHSLITHAKHEAGHHLMLIDDTRLLSARWNERRTPALDADALMAQPATPAMRDYIRLHEETIAGELPYGQVAIELEIERMSTTFGPRLMQQCRRVLAPEVLAGLSFIKEHVAVDVGHTALNEKLMARLLLLRPDASTRLSAIGSEALRIYVRFFGECLAAARRDVARVSS
ncbi:MAG TPA: hypothetical protein VGL86_05340 [Polyangia bacterium]|jgi:hypothetical protein